MMYLGGKYRLAPKITPTIARAALSGSGRYIEPFVGGAAILERVAKDCFFTKMMAGDTCEDLILMWKAIQMGWTPPSEVPFSQYEAMRHAAPSPLRGFVGFGCSTYGKWFGGYARHEIGNNDSTKPGDSARSCLRAAPYLKNVRFFHRSYDDWKLEPGDVVYCDPPYSKTTDYAANKGDFDHALFWAWCKQQADREVRVIVSESTPPPMEADSWAQVWWTERTIMIGDTHVMDRKDNKIHDALYVPYWLADQVMTTETFPETGEAW